MKTLSYGILIFAFVVTPMAFADSQTNQESIFFDRNQIKPKVEQKYYSGEVGFYGVLGVNTSRARVEYINYITNLNLTGEPQAGGGFYSNLETANRFVPNWHLSIFGSTNINNTNTSKPDENIYIVADNALYWNLIPENIDFVKLDLGVNLRLGTIFYMATAMLYFDLDFNVPNTGLHFNLLSKNGFLMDFSNHDLKLSMAYEFATPKVNPGLEVGYHLWTSYLLNAGVNHTFLTHTGYLAFYLKW